MTEVLGMELDPFSSLLLMCLCMLFGSLFAGYLPLLMAINENSVRAVTTFGVGLLIGTAVTVVLPEGIHTLVAACPSGAHHEHESPEVHEGHEAHAMHGHEEAGHVGHEGHDHGMEGCLSNVGLWLIAGFALQLLIDRLGAEAGSGHLHSHGSSVSHTHGASSPVSPLSDDIECTSPTGSTGASADDADDLADANGTGANDDEDVSGKSKPRLRSRTRGPSTGAMLGLLIHSAVDGVAVGAASFSGGGSVQMVVFLAIMLHKAPAAFGFTSFLMRSGTTNTQIANRLLIFSCAAPVAAIVTFALLGMQMFAYAQEGLGSCLLFSAGTFLYVATSHILPEIQASEGPGPLPWKSVILLFVGMISPLFLSVEHSH